MNRQPHKHKAHNAPRKTRTNGQTLVEYVILISIVAAAFVAMSPYMKRGIQAVIKVTSDQLAPQKNSDISIDPKKRGYLLQSLTAMGFAKDKELRESYTSKEYIYNELEATHSSSATALGVTEKSD